MFVAETDVPPVTTPTVVMPVILTVLRKLAGVAV